MVVVILIVKIVNIVERMINSKHSIHVIVILIVKIVNKVKRIINSKHSKHANSNIISKYS